MRKINIFGTTFLLAILPQFFQATTVQDFNLKAVAGTWHLLDQGEVVVCGPERNTIFTNSDVSWKRDLDGQFRRMEQLIQQDIMGQQVIAEKMPLDPTAADKYVETMKKQNNLTDSDLAELFDQVGRTFLEGIDLLNSQYVHELFMHYKFKSQLIPTEDQIADYYKEHPQYTQEWCLVKLGDTKKYFATRIKKLLKQKLDDIVAGKEVSDIVIDWGNVITLAKEDISSDKQFIFNMSEDQILVEDKDDTFELYKLVSKDDKSCKLQLGLVSDESYKALQEKVAKRIKKKLESVDVKDSVVDNIVEWESEIKALRADISEDKLFIFDLSVGQIHLESTNNGFYVYKLLEKEEAKLKSLEESRSFISNQLNQNKLSSMFDAYNKEVRKFIDIINLNENVSIEE